MWYTGDHTVRLIGVSVDGDVDFAKVHTKTFKHLPTDKQEWIKYSVPMFDFSVNMMSDIRQSDRERAFAEGLSRHIKHMFGINDEIVYCFFANLRKLRD